MRTQKQIEEAQARMEASLAADAESAAKQATEWEADLGPGRSMPYRVVALQHLIWAMWEAFGEHEDGCPEDDTCGCCLVARINTALQDFKGDSP